MTASMITTYTAPAEINNKLDAIEYVRVWQRRVDKLPATMPLKVKKEYHARLTIAQGILEYYSGCESM